MPETSFDKPWHGIPREETPWYPTINEDICIGWDTRVTSCGRSVHRFDFERTKAIVAEPMNCMVSCRTCSNSCPTNAISFPSSQIVLGLEERPEVRHSIEDELLVVRRAGLTVRADRRPDRDELSGGGVEPPGRDPPPRPRRLPQDADMLRDRRLGQRRLGDQIAGDTGSLLGEEADDPNARRLNERSSQHRQRLVDIPAEDRRTGRGAAGLRSGDRGSSRPIRNDRHVTRIPMRDERAASRGGAWQPRR